MRYLGSESSIKIGNLDEQKKHPARYTAGIDILPGITPPFYYPSHHTSS